MLVSCSQVRTGAEQGFPAQFSVPGVLSQFTLIWSLKDSLLSVFVRAGAGNHFDTGLNFQLRTLGWEAGLKFNCFLKELFGLPFPD